MRGQIVEDGIKIEWQHNQDIYQSDDIIRVQVKVTNTTASALPVQTGTTSFGLAGCVGIHIYLDNGTDRPLLSADEPVASNCQMLYDYLKPGESIEKTARFTTRYH